MKEFYKDFSFLISEYTGIGLILKSLTARNHIPITKRVLKTYQNNLCVKSKKAKFST